MSEIVQSTSPATEPPAVSVEEPAPNIPVLPRSWQCTAVLHPYSPPPSSQRQSTPFFQLCTASISYIEGQILSVQVVGTEYGTWWYKIAPRGTTVSMDQGRTWTSVDARWNLPSTRWLTSSPTYFATGYLNWMQAQRVAWWKQAVPRSRATTWIWFDDQTSLPFRMMFGAPPPTPTTGDPNQLAFFQNFSFTYFPSFTPSNNPNVSVWSPAAIPGFQAGNPSNSKLVVWKDCFYMTTYMTPVDSASMPLPTRVAYQWKPDNNYRIVTDRAQLTAMSYQYNPQARFAEQVALLYGIAPRGVPPTPNSGNGFLYNEIFQPERKVIACQKLIVDGQPLGQEPPDWARIPAVRGTIHASVRNNAALCPNQSVNIISVVFPPSTEYPQGRYLWTWYSPFPGSDGTHARPVTFMESASTISEGGTSLALADYFNYQEFQNWFDPTLFALPKECPR